MKNILQKYLNSIKNISADTKELTYRGELGNFILSVRDLLNFTNLEIIHEPKNDETGLGAPDFIILKDNLPQGIIENKKLDTDLTKIANSIQILKYYKLCKNILICDYLNFYIVSFRKEVNKKGNEILVGEINNSLSVNIPKKVNKNELNKIAEDLKNLFFYFFSQNAEQITTARIFAEKLAIPTQWLKNDLEHLSNDENISFMHQNFMSGIYENLSFDEFCDNFAQTTTYSLFLAKFRKDTEIQFKNKQNIDININNLSEFIGQSFAVLNAISKNLDTLQSFPTLKKDFELIVNLINNVNTNSLLNEFKQYIKNVDNNNDDDSLNNISHNPAIHFYEHFISAYDADLRKDRGVFYTPDSVVKFIICAVDDILKQNFNFSNGLENATSEKSNITLLDFATGTGTFLLEAFDCALKNKKNNVTEKEIKTLINNFKGFELMVAPYTIAHLNLSIAFKDKYQKTIAENERLNIFLTNTLESDQSKQASLLELKKEAEIATKIKEQDILIITGNPPYSAKSQNKHVFTEKIHNRYKKIMENPKNPTAILRNNVLDKEKNPKGLLDDYVKFICFAEQKIEKSKKGVFAFISNNSFLDNTTFRGVRYSLLNTFDKIYILNLHGDVRKKEKDKNVFDIQQGVSINIFIKLPNITSKKLAEVFYYELGENTNYFSRQDKFDFLNSKKINEISWNKLQHQKPFFLFIPPFINDDVNATNNAYKKLKNTYDKFYSIKEIFNITSIGVSTGNDELFIANTREILESKINNFSSKYIKNINYRPFDFRYIYYDTDKLDRARTKITQHFTYLKYNARRKNDIKNNIAIICGRGTKLQKLDNVFITTLMPDRCLASATSYIMPLYLYSTENNKEIKISNFTTEFKNFIIKKYGENTFTYEQIFYYIYGILFNTNFRKKYYDFLKLDFPKIPFVKDTNLFLKYSNLGKQLANSHLLNELTNIKIRRKFNEDLIKNEFIEKVSYDKKNQIINVNPSLSFNNVSANIWNYTIAGNLVLNKYLKNHKDEELDIEHFEAMIFAIEKTIEIENEIATLDFENID